MRSKMAIQRQAQSDLCSEKDKQEPLEWFFHFQGWECVTVDKRETLDAVVREMIGNELWVG